MSDSDKITTDIVPADEKLVGVSVPQQHAAIGIFGTADPVEVLAKATRVADALTDVVDKKRLFKQIGAKKHIYFEAWQFLGSVFGFAVKTEWSRPIEKDGKFLGFEARVIVVDANGRERAGAEAECMADEANWGNRDSYALRSMAQTRAGSKAIRAVLGWIAVLAGYDACPADEVPPGGFDAPRSTRITPPEQGARDMGDAFDEADVRYFEERVRQAATVADVDAIEKEAERLPTPEARKRVHVAAGVARTEFKRAEATASKTFGAAGKKPKGTAKQRDALLLSFEKARTMADVKAVWDEVNKWSWGEPDLVRLGDRKDLRKADFENASEAK